MEPSPPPINRAVSKYGSLRDVEPGPTSVANEMKFVQAFGVMHARIARPDRSLSAMEPQKMQGGAAHV
jgi:hypothetical protein